MKIIDKYASSFTDCIETDINKIFKDFKKCVYNINDQKRHFIFIPPKNAALKTCIVVAHLDTVHTPHIDKYDKNLGIYHGAGFDCRSGFFACMKLYKSCENVGVLLTDYEEIGESTAFYASEVIGQYNIALLLELDKAGNGYTFYDFYNSSLCNLLSKLGVVETQGSYSDVCQLDFIGICGVNLGVGYSQAHSKNSYQSKDGLMFAIGVAKKIALSCFDTVYYNENQLLDDDYNDDYRGIVELKNFWNKAYYQNY